MPEGSVLQTLYLRISGHSAMTSIFETPHRSSMCSVKFKVSIKSSYLILQIIKLKFRVSSDNNRFRGSRDVPQVQQQKGEVWTLSDFKVLASNSMLVILYSCVSPLSPISAHPNIIGEQRETMGDFLHLGTPSNQRTTPGRLSAVFKLTPVQCLNITGSQAL